MRWRPRSIARRRRAGCTAHGGASCRHHCLAFLPFDRGRPGGANRYPGSEWDRITPEQAGWSASELDAAQKWSTLIGTTSVVIIQRGAIVASWGDVSADILLNSARKSLLSALIGIAVGNHQIDLNDTLARLGIDDNAPSLTPDEKQATVADLLEARSGVYHGANYETLKMAALKPPRGSHPHGTFWYI